MKKYRLERINSLLKRVIYEIIQRDVSNPNITLPITVTRVETTGDLSHAKVYVSIMGTPEQKAKNLVGLQSAARFIAVNSHKKKIPDLRHFPNLTFYLDTGLEHQIRIQEVLTKLEQEKPE